MKMLDVYQIEYVDQRDTLQPNAEALTSKETINRRNNHIFRALKTDRTEELPKIYRSTKEFIGIWAVMLKDSAKVPIFSEFKWETFLFLFCFVLFCLLFFTVFCLTEWRPLRECQTLSIGIWAVVLKDAAKGERENFKRKMENGKSPRTVIKWKSYCTLRML